MGHLHSLISTKINSVTALDLIIANYFVIIYGITWVISLISYKKYFDTYLKYFPIIIGYTFCSELLGGLVLYNDYFKFIPKELETYNRHIIYNIYHLLFFSYFFYIYLKTTFNGNRKIFIKYGILTFIITSLINSVIHNPLNHSLIYSYIFGSILLLYCTFMHLKETYKSHSFNIIKYNLLFWTSIGLFLFHITYLPLKILREFSYELYTPYRQLHLAMIVIMYLIFIFGFITNKRGAFR